MLVLNELSHILSCYYHSGCLFPVHRDVMNCKENHPLF